MKITKARLKEIIQEETLKEIHPTVQDPLELIQAALGTLGELNQLIDDVGDDTIDPTLRETLRAHLATISRHLEAASAPLMPGKAAPGEPDERDTDPWRAKMGPR